MQCFLDSVEALFLFDRIDALKVVLGARRPRNNRDWPKVGMLDIFLIAAGYVVSAVPKRLR